MQKYYWPPHSVVIVTTAPFAVYMTRAGTEADLERRAANADTPTGLLAFDVDPTTGNLVVTKTDGLTPSPTLAPAPTLFPRGNETATLPLT